MLSAEDRASIIGLERECDVASRNDLNARNRILWLAHDRSNYYYSTSYETRYRICWSLFDFTDTLSRMCGQVMANTNPTAIKNQEANSNILFSDHCKAWLSRQNLAESTRKDLVQRIEKNLYPYMDSKYHTNYTTRDLFEIMNKMSDRRTRENSLPNGWHTASTMLNELEHPADEMGYIYRRPTQQLVITSHVLDSPKKGFYSSAMQY